MADPATLFLLTAFVVKNAPSWLTALRGTIFDQSRDALVEKGRERIDLGIRHRLRLDEKEQLRHLEQALKNAVERGLSTYDALQMRDQYRDILETLSQPGPTGEGLRQETMRLFMLAETPDLSRLTEIYNRRQRISHANHQDIDAGPYLNAFFSALLGELYADPYFKAQLKDVLQVRAATSMQHSLLDIVHKLQWIGETLEENYTAADLVHDISIYTAHIERTLHHLKIVGIVPKDQNPDPKLGEIFVQPHITLREQQKSSALDQRAGHNRDELVAVLDHTQYLVLLGDPGSGKSTTTKYLAWSHAAAASQDYPEQSQRLCLPGQPLPLRIELRLLNEERKRAGYDFLSYTTEVLLKREGVEINAKMFQALLTRRGMVLIFDGLDEVTTLEERLGFINEIEHFALSYPGNRILITSRPVGYDFARVSHPLFSHADVQPFDDTQIQQFLENWYTSVLRLTSIPPQEQEELNLLLTTLKENTRLHKLAENPLLLTVITVLHRYERLPDRRVQVYDRCADLLLETWARLKGTYKRWQAMKMTKDNQYACVAYLGFLLHTRSQEEVQDQAEETEETTVDVTSRFLQKSVTNFLQQRKLIVQGVEQEQEAGLFIELMQREAGLIVERGKDENGEALYSFVHRTFQEYFAAADIYERYQQKEDPKIISKFLKEHLHDPHWREVIALLLGKLKSTPVTNQLRTILQGKSKSARSAYTQFIQQDLFFVCDCLVEEIQVEHALVELVVSQLKEVVKNPYFPAQQQDALDYLGKLMQTRQYAEQGKKALLPFAIKEGTLDEAGRLAALQALYVHSIAGSQERSQAMQSIMDLAKRPDLSVEQVWQTAESLYQFSPEGSEQQLFSRVLLTDLLKRPDLSVERVQQTAVSLYIRSPKGSEQQLFSLTLLTDLLKRPDLSVEQIQQTAESLYQFSPEGSEQQLFSLTVLTDLLKCPDLSVEQVWQTAVSLYRRSREGSEEERFSLTVLTDLLKCPDLSVEQIQQTAESLYQFSPKGSEQQLFSLTVLTDLLKRPDLSVEQIQQTAVSLYRHSPEGFEQQLFSLTLLTDLLKRPDLSVELIQQTAESLYQISPEGSEQQLFSLTVLTDLLKRPDLSVELIRQTAVSLYRHSPEGSETELFSRVLLTDLLKRPDLSVEQIRQTAESLYFGSPEGSEVTSFACTMLTDLLKRPDLSVEQIRQTAESLYQFSPEGSEQQLFSFSLLTNLLKRPDLSAEWVQQIAEFLYFGSPEGSETRLFATSILLKQLSRSNQAKGTNNVYHILRRMVSQFHLLQ